MYSRLHLFSLVNVIVVLLSDLHVIEGALSLQIHPAGQHLVLFDSAVKVSCFFSQKTTSVHAIWHIDGTRYTISDTFPQGIQLAFSNTSASQLLIPTFRRDLDQTQIQCSVLENPTSDRVFSDTVTLQGTDVLPSSSTATTMVSTTTVPVVTDSTDSTTPRPTSGPTTEHPSATQSNQATEDSAAAPLSSATRLVVFVSLLVSLGFSFASCHYIMY